MKSSDYSVSKFTFNLLILSLVIECFKIDKTYHFPSVENLFIQPYPFVFDSAFLNSKQTHTEFCI